MSASSVAYEYCQRLIHRFAENRKTLTSKFKRSNRHQADNAMVEALENRILLSGSDVAVAYVDDDWAALSIGVDPDGDGPAGEYGVDAFASIQDAIDNLAADGTIHVADGTYTENLSITQNLTLLSDNGRDVTFINGLSGEGASGAITISNATTDVQIGDINQGFSILGIDNGNAAVENAAVYLQGSHSGMSIIGNEIIANGDHGLLTEYSAAITNMTVDSNIFSGQTFVGVNPGGEGFSQQFSLDNVPRQLVAFGGGATSNNNFIAFTNNDITGTAGGVNINGDEQGNSLVTIDTQNSIITGNTFEGTTTRYGAALRARGSGNATITGNTFISTYMGENTSMLYTDTNTINSVYPGLINKIVEFENDFDGGAYISGGSTVTTGIEGIIENAVAGTIIHVLAGNYDADITISQNDITVYGPHSEFTKLDSGRRAIDGEAEITGGFRVQGDDVTLAGLTILNGIGPAGIGDITAVHLAAGTTGHTIANNAIIGTDAAGSRGIVASSPVGSFTVVNNDISAWTSGMYINPGSDGVQVLNNIIHDNFVGMSADNAINLSVANNFFTNNSYEHIGLGTPGAGVVITENSFDANSPSVSNYGGVEVDASTNWWGTTDLALIGVNLTTNASSDVDYSPILNDGTDLYTYPEHYYLPDYYGFQPDTGNVTVHTQGSQDTGSVIQEALDALSNGDTLILDGDYTGDITIGNGLIVGGDFTTDGQLILEDGATLAPGNSPAIVNVGGLAMGTGETLAIELFGTTAGTEHDQVNVTGTVDITDSTLDLTLGYYPTTSGASFTIINNDDVDSIVGTFAGLAEGATFTLNYGGVDFDASITYVGGDGNDVVITTDSYAITDVYVDDDWAGLSVGDDPDGVGPLQGIGFDAFANIQDAIDAVNPRGNVYVAAGHYVIDSTITTNKSVNLIGAQADNDPRTEAGLRTAGDANESVIDGNGLVDNLIDLSFGVITINGFEFRESTDAAVHSDHTGNATISNNIIHDSDNYGIEIISPAFTTTIQNNLIFNTGNDGITATSRHGIPQILDNELHNITASIAAIHVYDSNSALIDGNIVRDVLAGDGIRAGNITPGTGGFGGSTTITNNTVYNIAGDGIASYGEAQRFYFNEVYNTSGPNGGIYATRVASTNIQNNYVHDNVYGISVGSGDWIRLDNNTLENNSSGHVLIDSSFGGNGELFSIYYSSFDTNSQAIINNCIALTAPISLNWFGTTDLSIIASNLAGSVYYNPILVSGIDTDANAIGFQPDTSALIVHTNGRGINRISIGVKYVDPNGTVTVTQGDYTDSVTVDNGIRLEGKFNLDGTLTFVDGATFAPGNSPTIVNTGDLSMTTGTTLEIELFGTTPGSEYDQVNVTGTVDITDATLDLSLGYLPSSGDQFTIINNDATDAITGTFSGLAEGDTVTANYNGVDFDLTISYVGGDGNDVVLSLDNTIYDVIYVDDDWTGTGFGNDPDAGGPASIYGVNAFDNISDAIAAVNAGGTIHIAAGDYDQGTINLNKDGVTLTGAQAGTNASSRDNVDVTDETVIHGTIVVGHDVTGATIDGLFMQDFTNSSAEYFGVFVSGGADQTTVQNVYFQGTAPDVLQNGIVTSIAGTTNNVFTQNVYNNTYYGVYLNPNSVGNEISDSLITNTRIGYVIDTAENTTVTGNTFDSSTGVYFWDGGTASVGDNTGVTIENNTFQNGTGIRDSYVTVNDPGLTVDLSNNTFDGKLPSAMSLSELFDLEDRITHAIDDAAYDSLGIVVADNLYVTQLSSSIQNGIDAATAGDTLYVQAGTFTENLTVDKTLQILGAGSGLTILEAGNDVGINVTTGGTSAAEADRLLINGMTINNAASMGIDIDGTVSYITIDDVDVNVDGVSRTDYGINIAATADVTDLLIDNSNFSTNSEGAGMHVHGSVDGLTIIDSHFDGNNIGFYAFQVDGSDTVLNNVDISDTSFSNNTYKGMYIEKLSNALLDNITINNSGTLSGTADGLAGYEVWPTGIDLNLKYYDYENITIQNSSITDSGTANPANGAGLAVKTRDDGSYATHPATLNGLTVVNNFINGSQTAIRVGEPGKGNTGLSNVSMDFNDLSGSLTENIIDNQSIDDVNASANWFGTADLTSIANAIIGAVDFSPIIETGIDTQPGTNGFQPDLSALTVHLDGSQVTGLITEAMSLIADNGIITVDSGTYTDNVTIGSAVTIQGDFDIDGTLTLTDGAVFAPGNSPAIVNTGDLSMTAGTTLEIELDGPTVGTEYDQVNVTGTVDITDATLDVALNHLPSSANEFVIVNNDGADAVVGTFDGLAEGDTITIDGIVLTISYVGGDGNDISLSTASNFDVIYVDDDWSGTDFGNDPDAGGPAGLYGVNAFDNINDAMDAVNTGGTIYVLTGSYTEGVSIDKSVNLLGANADVDPTNSGVRNAESTIIGNVNIVSDDVVFNGFELTDYNYNGLTIGGQVSNIVISNNYIHDSIGGNTAILLSPDADETPNGEVVALTNIDIFNNYVVTNSSINNQVGIRFSGPAYTHQVQYNQVTIDSNEITGTGVGHYGIFSGSNPAGYSMQDAVITNNYIHDVASGINLGNMFNGLVDNNLIDGTSGTGASLGVIDGTISNNTFANVGSQLTEGGTAAIGIWGTEYGFTATTNATLTGNVIYFNDNANATISGVYTREGADSDNIHINENSFINGGQSADAFAVANWSMDDGMLDASNNWWSTTDASEVAALTSDSYEEETSPGVFETFTSGDVDSSPFLESGTDIDGSTAGFQGDFSSLTVHTFGAQTDGLIQEGIDDVDVNGTVHVAAGTYAEHDIVVDKAVSIVGEGSDVVTVDHHYYQSGHYTTGFDIQSDDINISGMTLENAVYTINVFEQDITNLSLSDVVIQKTQSVYYAPTAIRINDSIASNINIDHVEFYEMYKGISVGGSAGNIVNGLSITNSKFISTDPFRNNVGISTAAPLTNLVITDSLFSGNKTGITSSLNGDTLIENNTFSENNFGILFTKGSAASIDEDGEVIVNNNQFTNNAYAALRTVVFSDLSNRTLDVPITIRNNTITQDVSLYTIYPYQFAIDISLMSGPTHETINIIENNITLTGTPDSKEYGAIAVRGGLTDVNIERNTLEGGNIGSYPGLVATSGIVLSTNHVDEGYAAYIGEFDSSDSLYIANNFINNFDAAFSIIENSGYISPSYLSSLPTDAQVVLYNNDLSGNTAGIVALESGETIDASNNWWGSTDVSTVAGMMSGNVDFSPFLESGTDTDLATEGFQGDFSVLTAHDEGAQTSNIIYEAIRAVDTNGTVHVDAGTYQTSSYHVKPADEIDGPIVTEYPHLYVDKAVNLLGANAGINPNTESRGEETTILGSIVIAAPYVNLDGFELTGDVDEYSQTNILGKLYLASGIGGTTLQNLYIHDVDFGEVPVYSNEVIILSSSADTTIIDNNIQGGMTFYHNSLSSTSTGSWSSTLIKDNVIGGIGSSNRYGNYSWYYDFYSLQILDNQLGSISLRSLNDALIDGNTFSGGISATGSGTISNNDLRAGGALYLGLSDSIKQNAGATFDITHNFFTYNTSTDIAETAVIYLNRWAGASSIHINENSFTDGGARNDANAVINRDLDDHVLDLSNNWWDTTDINQIVDLTYNLTSQGSENYAGLVDTSPFLESGTDTDLITPGFQGDFSALTAHVDSAQTTGNINEALSNVEAGGIVHVLDGTYTEDVTVDNGVTVAGSFDLDGTLSLTGSAQLLPGNSPGIVSTGDFSADSSSIIGIELDGADAGTGYDQIQVTGTVDITDATLDLSLNYLPSGEEFVIIDNDGSDAVIGAFDGYAEGSTFVLTDSVSGEEVEFTITYTGGDGNDVVLTTNEPPTANNVAINATEDGPAVLGNFDGADPNANDSLTYQLVDLPTNGTVINNNDGTFSYTAGDLPNLNNGETKQVTFTYKAVDNHGEESSLATVTVTVSGVNEIPDGPVAYLNGSVDNAFTTSDSDVDIDVIANDTGENLHVTRVDLTSDLGATVSINPDGTIHYEPGSVFDSYAPGQEILDYFRYDLQDPYGNGDTTRVNVWVTVVDAVNDAPVAENVAGNAVEDGPAVTLAFNADDQDSDDTPSSLTYSIVSSPSFGSVINNGDGTFSYTSGDLPELDFGENQQVTFTYKATDSHGLDSNVATVTITIAGQNEDSPENDAPIAMNVAGNVSEDGPAVTLAFDADDTDADDDPTTLTYTILSTPANGILINNGDGTFSFDPDGDFEALTLGQTQDVVFTYKATDSHGADSNTSTVTITVNGANEAAPQDNQGPSGSVDAFYIQADVVANLDVVANDTDPNNDVLHVQSLETLTSEAGVPLSINPDGTVRYNPNGFFDHLAPGETYRDTFRYTVADPYGLPDTTRVFVYVVGVDSSIPNAAPVANNINTSTSEDLSLSLFFDATDADDALASLTFNILSSPAAGSVINNGDGTFTFNPGADFQSLNDGQTDQVSFTYEVVDPHGATSNTATVTITINGANESTGENNAPIAQNVAGTAQEDGAPVNYNFNANDIDSDDDPTTLTYTILSSPSEGSVINNGNGSFTFNPGPDFQDLGIGQTREVSFTYKTTDSHGVDSNVATVSITVSGTNDGTTAVPNLTQTTVDQPIDIDVLSNDFDKDGDTVSVAVVDPVSELGISLTINADGTIHYDPSIVLASLPEGTTVRDSFRYNVTDPYGLQDRTRVFIDVTANSVSIASFSTGSSSLQSTAPTSLAYSAGGLENLILNNGSTGSGVNQAALAWASQQASLKPAAPAMRLGSNICLSQSGDDNDSDNNLKLILVSEDVETE